MKNIDFYLKSPRSILTPGSLLKTVFEYILNEFRKSIDTRKFSITNDYLDENGENLLQIILQHSDKKLRMYGTAEELAENIKIYTNFTGSHTFFHLDNWNPYNTTPIAYRSLKNEKYFAKPDIFVILQNMLFSQMSKGFDSTTAKFFKAHERLLSGNLEFVRHDPEVFEEIKNEIHELTRINYETQKDFDTFIEHLQRVMRKRPEMFLPYSNMENKRVPITVRMFEDGNQKFVMKAEFFEAINKASPEYDPIDYEFEYDWQFSTIEMNEVFRDFRNRIDNIEFIRTPILRAKHRAVPIKGPYSEFYVLGVDALFHFLKNIIFAVKMFQKPFIKSEEKLVFDSEVEHILFFKWKEYSRVVERFYEEMRQLENLPSNDIRDVKEDGFTVEDLKDELKYLGLTIGFPEIIDHAEIVYEEVNRVKKERYLRTCDLFDAIEHCQLICIFNRVPNLRKFLHNQKSCGRVLTLKCDSCIPKPSKTLSAENFDSQNSTKFPEHTESMNTKIAECSWVTSVPEERISKGSDENLSDLSSANQDSMGIAETSKLTDSRKITSSGASPSEDSTQDTQVHTKNRDILSMVSQKNESQTCSKCFRSSEMLNETKKELKISQNKVTSLETKISGIEKNMIEKKSIIEKLVEEQKQQLERKQKEIDDLKQNFATQITCANRQHAEFKLELSKRIDERIKIVEDIKKSHLEIETQLKKENSKLEIKVKEAEKRMTEEKRKNKKMVDDQKKELKNFKEGHEIISKENDGLKLKLSKLENIQVQLKEENSKQDQSFQKSKTDLMERISRLEKDLNSEKQKTEQLRKQVKESQEKSARIKINEEQKLIAEKRQFDHEIFEKTWQINKFLHASKTRLMAEYEESEKMIQQLQDNLSSTYVANPMTFYPYNQDISHHCFTPLNSHQPTLNPSNGFVQTGYVPTSGTLLNNHAPSTSSVNSLTSQHMGPFIYCPTNSSQPSMNILEKQGRRGQFVKKQKPKVTDSTMYQVDCQISSQPPFINPTVSNRSSQMPSSSSIDNRAHSKPPVGIQKKQEKSNQTTQSNSQNARDSDKSMKISSDSVANNCAPSKSSVKEIHSSPTEIMEEPKKNAQQTPSNTELGDSECLICVCEMGSKEKTIKCHQCRRRYHSDCASKWLKVKSECPACRGRLLDPYEFPSLS